MKGKIITKELQHSVSTVTSTKNTSDIHQYCGDLTGLVRKIILITESVLYTFC